MSDIERPSEADDAAGGFRLSNSPSHLLRRAQQFASEIFEDASLTDNVTLRQAVVLAAVAELGRSSQADLVIATGVDRSTMAEMIARMEKKGLVSRKADERDARAKAVTLTDAGRKRLEAALPTMRKIDEALLDLLPRNRRNAFCDTLRIIARAAGEADLDGEAEEAGKSKGKASKSGDKSKKKKAKAKAKATKARDKSKSGAGDKRKKR